MTEAMALEGRASGLEGTTQQVLGCANIIVSRLKGFEARMNARFNTRLGVLVGIWAATVVFILPPRKWFYEGLNG